MVTSTRASAEPALFLTVSVISVAPGLPGPLGVMVTVPPAGSKGSWTQASIASWVTQQIEASFPPLACQVRRMLSPWTMVVRSAVKERMVGTDGSPV
jgi:hypothetical protein